MSNVCQGTELVASLAERVVVNKLACDMGVRQRVGQETGEGCAIDCFKDDGVSKV